MSDNSPRDPMDRIRDGIQMLEYLKAGYPTLRAMGLMVHENPEAFGNPLPGTDVYQVIIKHLQEHVTRHKRALR